MAESLQHRRHLQQHHALHHHCRHGQYSSGSSLHAAALLRVCEEIVAQWTLHLSGKMLGRRWENVGSQDTSNAISAANALQWLGLGARKVHWQMAKVQKSGYSSFCLHRISLSEAGKPSHQFLCSEDVLRRVFQATLDIQERSALLSLEQDQLKMKQTFDRYISI